MMSKSMISTPDVSHLAQQDYQHVYEPAEDTFLFLDALEQDAEHLKKNSPRICLEIGSGSGCVSCFAGKILGSSSLYLCTDINPGASRCTSTTGHRNRVLLHPLIASLASPFHLRLHHMVDILLFNPPYVPTLSSEAHSAQQTAGIQGSWAGGTDGMQIIDLFLPFVEHLLSPDGRFYLVAVKRNDIPTIRRRMLDDHGLQSEVVLQRRAGLEHLFVLRFAR